MPPFPLLRLPRLVLCEVFKSLSIEGKIMLSLCSKKISAQINNDRLYSQKAIVNLDISKQEVRVHYENDKDTFQVLIDLDIGKRHHSNSGISHNSTIQQTSIACRTVNVMSIQIGIRTYWKNHREGFLSVIRHLLEMFPCKISTSSNCHSSDSFQPTIAKLFDLQLKFELLTIELEGLNHQNLLWNHISNQLGFVENLRIISFANPGFIPVFTSWPQEISILGSAWFTLETLLACTCTKIRLAWSYLENQDLDEILRKWRAGGFPNLEYLCIQSQNISNGETRILGMSLSEIIGNVIQNDDGSKTASINIGIKGIEISVTPFK